MADFRALCADLLRELEHASSWDYQQALKDQARAALAEPEPEGPTKSELRQIFDDQSGYINNEQVMWWSDFHSAARAVLARWGTPNSAETRSSLGDGPAVSGDREPDLALRVQRLEAMRETEKAALLDAFKQIDKLQHRLDFQYTKLCRIEEATEDGQA